MTAGDHEKLIAREKPAYDGAEPSGASVALLCALRLHTFTSDDRWRADRRPRASPACRATLTENPLALTEALLALDYATDEPREIAIVWPRDAAMASAAPLLDVLRRTFVPNRAIAAACEADVAALGALVPWIADKAALDGRADRLRLRARPLRAAGPRTGGAAPPRWREAGPSADRLRSCVSSIPADCADALFDPPDLHPPCRWGAPPRVTQETDNETSRDRTSGPSGGLRSGKRVCVVGLVGGRRRSRPVKGERPRGGRLGGRATASGGVSGLGGGVGSGGASGLGGSVSSGGASGQGGVAGRGGATGSGGGPAARRRRRQRRSCGGAERWQHGWRGGRAGSTGTGGGSAGNGGRAGGTGTGGSGSGGTGGAPANACNGAASGAYYLDSAAGSDSNDGMSPATAWKTLAKVNGVTLPAGQQDLPQGRRQLDRPACAQGLGNAAPRRSSSTSTVQAPSRSLAAGSADADTVHLLNQQYWEINDLEVTNKKTSVGDYRGISINGQNGGTLNHIYIRSCFVHDVTGEVLWIGGDTADNAPGITFQSGWDASKRTGGIVFDVQAGTGTAVKTKFNDVLVEDNVVQDCSFGGIIFKQLDGTVHWGTRSSATSTTWTPHTNVVVRGNYLSPAQHQLRLQRHLHDQRAGRSHRTERHQRGRHQRHRALLHRQHHRSTQRDLRDQGEGGRRRLERHGHRQGHHQDGDPVQLLSRQRRRDLALPVLLRRLRRPLQHHSEQQPLSDLPALRSRPRRAPSTTTPSTTTRPTPASPTVTARRSTPRTPSRTTSSTRPAATAC